MQERRITCGRLERSQIGKARWWGRGRGGVEEKGTRQDNLDEVQEAVRRFREEPGAAPGGSSGTVHRNTPPLLRVEGRLCTRNSAGSPSGHFRDVVSRAA